ncbi:hypothetical protein ZTR_09848 [Talaromyces verruculosus]|nr:hypothetical protein ZTR_09848 [Talaromyces verruculosus]
MAPVSITWTVNGNTGYYDGEVDSTNIPHGYGTIEYTSGPLKDFRYEGNWYLGQKHGQGKLRGADYEHDGSFGTDQPEGHGVRNYKDGRIYDGWWKAGVREGTGTQTWKNTEWTYSGQWKSGRIAGKGTWHSESRGVTYNGDNWTDAKINGTGVLRFRRGAFYKGRFVNGSMEDTNGSYIYPNSIDEYNGGFKDNLRHGTGTLIMNGYKYHGNFVKDEMTGTFTVTNLATGKTTTRTY